LKLNGKHQLLICAYNVNILGGSVHNAKNTEALAFSSKEIRPEVNADKTKYMVVYRDHNAGKSHNIKSDNSSFEMVGEFQY